VKSSGLNLPIVANASNHSPKFIELGGKSAEGVYVSSSFLVDDPQPRVKRYVDAFKAKYGEAPDLFATVAYDGVYVIAAALKAAGNDRAKIKDAFSTITDIPSVIFGPVKFNPATRRFDNPKGAQLVVVDGAFVPWDGKKSAK
jgi:branched-chain amino acid transport system substrate-binding protein